VLARTRTLGELVPLLDDLVPTAPAPVVARPPDELRLRAEQHYEVLRGRALAAMLIPSLICAVVWVVGGLGPDGWDPVFPWPLFVLLGTGIAPLRLALRRTEVVAAEQARLERKERRRLEKGERGAQEADPDPDA
jgi:hypothetical protein